jgi:hypothetical protein
MFFTLTELNSCACVSVSLVVDPSKEIPKFHPIPSNFALKNSLKASTTLILTVES